MKDELFQRLVFVWTKASLAEGQLLHADFLKSCKLKIADGMLENVMEQEAAHYMNMLWAALVKEGCYNDWLSQKHSSRYQAIQDKFASE